MFNENKYTRWYYNIISNAQKSQRDGYTETHHIIPKSLGGDDSISNLVKLTPKEHYICHALLVKMVDSPKHIRSMYAAFNMMHVGRNGKKYTSKLYDYYKVKFYKRHSEQQMGKVRSLESRQKQSESARGKPWSEKKRASAWAGPTAKPVTVKIYKTGVYVGTYESISEAARALGCDPTAAWSILTQRQSSPAPNGKRYIPKQTKGYTFSYVNSDNPVSEADQT